MMSKRKEQRRPGGLVLPETLEEQLLTITIRRMVVLIIHIRVQADPAIDQRVLWFQLHFKVERLGLDAVFWVSSTLPRDMMWMMQIWHQTRKYNLIPTNIPIGKTL